MKPTPEQHEHFDALYRAYARRVHAYVRRHVAGDQVEEIVAETFLIAWRRRDRLDVTDPLPWLLVTARHVTANARRRGANGESATERIESLAAAVPAVDGSVVDRDAALAALATLTDTEREAVLLVAWDGLDNRSAAAVAGCSTRAFTVRLHRARLRLARLLDPDPDPDPTTGPGVPLLRAVPRPSRPRLIQENR